MGREVIKNPGDLDISLYSGQSICLVVRQREILAAYRSYSAAQHTVSHFEPGAHVCYADVTETLDFDVRIDEFNDIKEPEGEPEPISCGACSGTAYPMGDLGSRRHFRCRNCGWQASKAISEL